MTKNDYITLINSSKNGYWLVEKYCKAHAPDIYEQIQAIAFPETFSFQQKMYHFLNDIPFPLYTECGKEKIFRNFKYGYNTFCSNKCNCFMKYRSEKAKQTCLERYGVEHPMQSDTIKEKTKCTNIERYGVTCTLNDESTKRKIQQTCLERYGVENPMQSEIIKAKAKATLLKNYNVEHPLQNKEIKERATLTTIKNYGVENPMQSDDVKEKAKQTTLKRYGVEHISQDNETKDKIKRTNLERYGVENPMQSEIIKAKATVANLKRYGTEHPMQSDDVKEKTKQTCLERYGVEYSFQSDTVKEKIKGANIKKYGSPNPMGNDSIKNKAHITCLEKYGVEWACMRNEARSHHTISKINIAFAKLLDKNNIDYEMEFPLGSYSYDFKVGDTLIEINPTITHNTVFNPFGRNCIQQDYHLLKSKTATENGYRCIHIWDWDDTGKIISMLKPKQALYARKLTIQEVDETECNEFLNAYHLQNTCKGQSIRLGLYTDDMLVELMTFGKPRYNRNYEYELLRLCTHSDYIVVGGAERLFRHFVENYNPTSIISYCDASKFDGKVYDRLGFTSASTSVPTIHWYDLKTQQHITDNLLRQRGFDQLFNADYGKGTNNNELMLEHGFLPVYDCGQMSFGWKAEHINKL